MVFSSRLDLPTCHQAFPTGVWRSAPRTRWPQSKRILEAQWLRWPASCIGLNQRSSSVFRSVGCWSPLCIPLLTFKHYSRAIVVTVFILVGDRFELGTEGDIVVLTLGSPALLCVIGNRMFFNLKEAAEHGVNIGTNWSSYSHSAIHFDKPLDETEQ